MVKNVVELQKFDQELRVSYKPTRFSGWVVDHALQAERVANNEYLEKTKKADETRDAFMRVARDLDVVPIDDGVRKSAIDAYKSLVCADSVTSSR